MPTSRWRRRCARTTARRSRRAWTSLLKQENVRRIVVARGNRRHRRVGQRDGGLPGLARPRGPEQAVVRHAPGVRAGARRSTRACSRRVTNSGAVVQRVGGPVLAASLKGVDPGSIPSDHGELKVGEKRFDAASFTAPGFLRRDRSRRRAGAQDHGVLGRAQGPPAGGRHPGRLLHPRLHLRAAGLALAAAPDRRLPRGRAAPGLGRLHRRGPDRGPRRVRGAGRGVQQDVAPARGAPGGAQPGARAPAGRDAAHRRDVRREPRPRGPAGDRGQDRGRRRGRRRRPGLGARRTRARRSSRSRSPGRSTGSRRPCAPPRPRCSRPASRARRPSTASRALAHPMRRGDDVHARVSGVVSVARRDRPFSAAERELFHYLAEQAAVSIENVGLHETVERQAVTDELTGPVQPPPLPGGDGDRGRALQALRPAGGPRDARPRRLQDTSTTPTATSRATSCCARWPACCARPRARSTSRPATAARSWPSCCRGTDLEGAYNLAERVRAGIEALALPLLDGERHAAGHRELRGGGAARLRRRHAASSWRRPTRRSTEPSAPARTARCGLRPRPSCSSRPASLGFGAQWDCSTTRSGSISSSSGATVPTPARSRAWSTRRWAPPVATRRPPWSTSPWPPSRPSDDDLYLDDGGDRDEVIAEERLEAPIHHSDPEPEREPEPRPDRSRRRGTAGARAGARGRDRPAHAPVLAGGGRGRHGPAEGTPRSPTPRRGPRRRRPRTSSPPTTSPRRGRARGDAGVPAGDARARPALVRAEAAARLRLLVAQAPDVARRLHVARRWPATASPSSTTPTASTTRRCSRSRARRSCPRRPSSSRATEPGADYRNRIWTIVGELPFAGHPSLGTAVAVAHARRRARGALRPADGRRPAAGGRRARAQRRRARVDAPGAGGLRRRDRARAGLRGARPRRLPTRTPSCRPRSSRPGWPT